MTSDYANWIPVSERLPEMHARVLICWNDHATYNVAWRVSQRHDIGWASCQDGMELKPPTHWMPLPAAPSSNPNPSGQVSQPSAAGAGRAAPAVGPEGAGPVIDAMNHCVLLWQQGYLAHSEAAKEAVQALAVAIHGGSVKENPELVSATRPAESPVNAFKRVCADPGIDAAMKRLHEGKS